MDRRFRDRGLRVVGLHAPEWDTEKDPDNVRREVKALGVSYPVVLDNELKMWDALGTHYWPTLYVLDRSGRIRYSHIGEVHEKTPAALELERFVSGLLAEAS